MEESVYREGLQPMEGSTLEEGRGEKKSGREELLWTGPTPASWFPLAAWGGKERKKSRKWRSEVEPGKNVEMKGSYCSLYFSSFNSNFNSQ